jgi:hypothetical protein
MNMFSHFKIKRRILRSLIITALSIFLVFGLTSFPSVAYNQTGAKAPSQSLPMVHVAIVQGRPVLTTAASGAGGPSSPDKYTIIAKNQNGAQPMDIWNNTVYFYDYGAGTLNAVSESGGKVHVIAKAPTTDGSTYGLAASAGFVYWAFSDFASSESYLYATNVATHKTKTIFSASGILNTLGDSVNNATIYFVTSNSIAKISITGKGFKVLASNPSPLPWLTAYSNGYVYWYDFAYGEIGRVKATGGTPQILSPQLGTSASIYNGIRNMVVNGTEIYWTHNDNNNASLNRVSITGKGFKQLYTASSSSTMAGVAVFGGKVLFAAPSAIMAVKGTGGKATIVVNNVSARTIEVAAGEAYFTAVTFVAKAPA